MTPPHITLTVGAATVTLFNLAELRVTLSEWLPIPEPERPLEYASAFTGPQALPIYAVHIALPKASVLVDGCDAVLVKNTPYVPPDYELLPGLLEQLTRARITPDEVTHVVITHAHFDHYSGLVQEGTPLLPNARHYLGRNDHAVFQAQPTDEQQPLMLLQQRGLLEAVDAPLELIEGVTVLTAPGETPGHQLVRVHSQGETLYLVGDLYHHPLEVGQPERSVYWANAAANLQSRATLTGAALAEGARLVATHIARVGRLERDGAGVLWRDAD